MGGKRIKRKNCQSCWHGLHERSCLLKAGARKRDVKISGLASGKIPKPAEGSRDKRQFCERKWKGQQYIPQRLGPENISRKK